MEYLVTAGEMKACDQGAIQHFGVPSLVLMERAALALTELLLSRDFDLSRVLIICGSGNNGGDGFAMARLLILKKISVKLCFVGNLDHLTEEAAIQKKICENYGIIFVRNWEPGEYTTIVDAIFGSGLSRDVTGQYREIIQKVNSEEKAKVLSVDIPSGVRSSDGSIAGIAVKAHLTGALAFRKIGHVLYPGAACAGETVRLDIGITEECFLGNVPKTAAVTEEVWNWFPKRERDSNKGTYGKACLIAGSKNMCGAAYLSGKAAYLTGTGLVRVVSEECNREILQTLLPEAVLSTMDAYEEGVVSDALSWAGAVGVGPGLSQGEAAGKILSKVLKSEKKLPIVLDADALNLLAGHLEWLTGREIPVILTPHLGEMTRLTGLSIEELKKDRLQIARDFAREHRVILVLKDARTLITDGFQVFLNETGNDGMATGGSGDVLTGIITGLLSQKVEPLAASVLGVYLHGLAGDEARKRKGACGLLSSDLLDALPVVQKERQR